MKSLLLNPSTQIVLGLKVNLVVWILLFVLAVFLANKFITYKINKGALVKADIGNLTAKLDFWGSFVLATALGAVSAAGFGSPTTPLLNAPAVASIYNPMIGVYILYISYRLKIASYKN